MIKQYFEKHNNLICRRCGYEFRVTSFWKWLLMPHWFDKWRYGKCPDCGRRGWMPVIKDE